VSPCQSAGPLIPAPPRCIRRSSGWPAARSGIRARRGPAAMQAGPGSGPAPAIPGPAGPVHRTGRSFQLRHQERDSRRRTTSTVTAERGTLGCLRFLRQDEGCFAVCGLGRLRARDSRRRGRDAPRGSLACRRAPSHPHAQSARLNSPATAIRPETLPGLRTAAPGPAGSRCVAPGCGPPHLQPPDRLRPGPARGQARAPARASVTARLSSARPRPT
jgi:hypothetical protein